MQTLLDLFLTFADHADKTALIYRSGVRRTTCSYAKLTELTLKMNRSLAEQGIGPGDKVILWAPNSPWWAIAFWGIILRGAIVVPVDFMSSAERAATIADLTTARLVIQSRDKLERLSSYPALLIEELEFKLDLLEPLPPLVAADADDIAQLIYTSGTTGAPKGVILTHRNLITNLLQIDRHLPVVTADFTFLSLLPLSHMFEQMAGFFTPLSHGATIVYLRTLKPSAIMEALAGEDIHAMIVVPRLLHLLKGSIEAELTSKHLAGLLPTLLSWGERRSRAGRKRLFFPVQRKFGTHFTLFVSGGAPLDPELFRFWDTLGFMVVEGYGLSETSPVLTANRLEEQRYGSVGTVLPGVELRIDHGEILAKGANIFPGYYQNPVATSAAFTEDGWFRTGDLGELDQDGWLKIKGRGKDLIVTGAGINVYPDEIEGILNKLPGVREACVIGLDKGTGEEVHAVLLLASGEKDGAGIVAEANRHLDELHRISGFSLWPEADFPKTTTLKIQKFKVRQYLRENRQNVSESSSDPLLAIIARITGVNPGDITDDALLIATLGLSSIGRLELVSRIEQEFRLDLDDAAVNQTTRVGDLRRMVAQRKKVGGALRTFRFWTNSPLLRTFRAGCDLLLHYPLLRTFVDLESVGVEKLSRIKAPVLFIANHTSYFDQPTIMAALPRSWRYQTATAAWEEFFFKNFRNLGQRLWKRCAYDYGTVAFNLFPIPQSGPFRGALHFMGKLADHELNILLFPEGERSPHGRLLPFRPGLGIMVRELGIPVVPIRIAGLEKVLPRGANWPKRGRVTVTFGDPIYFQGEEPAEIVAKAYQALLALEKESQEGR